MLPSGSTVPANESCRVDIHVILMHWTQLPPRINEPQDMVGKAGDCPYRFPIYDWREQSETWTCSVNEARQSVSADKWPLVDM